MIEDNKKFSRGKKNENTMDNEDEPWHIVQLFSLYEFRDERATI